MLGDVLHIAIGVVVQVLEDVRVDHGRSPISILLLHFKLP